MTLNTRNYRTVSRQKLIDEWFSKFVEEELYTQKEYHSFCKRVKDKSILEIERIFAKEKSNC